MSFYWGNCCILNSSWPCIKYLHKGNSAHLTSDYCMRRKSFSCLNTSWMGPKKSRPVNLSLSNWYLWYCMDLLPDTWNCALCMRRECRERVPHHWLQRKPLVSNPGMHRGTCVTHVPWCMSWLLTHGSGENIPSIPGAYTIMNFTYLARGPFKRPIVV